MTDSPKKPGDASEPPSAGSVGNAGRRRLLRAGISTAPVAMTVLSRSVLAQGVCQSPSGFVSGNLSRVGATGPICSGRAPAWWADSQNFNAWPVVNNELYYPTKVTGPGGHNATKFKDVFTPDLDPPNNNKDLLEVLASLGTGQIEVARLSAATILNIAARFIPAEILTPAVIQHLWTEYARTGQFHPYLTAVWNEAEIIDYLRTTMPV